MIHWNTQTPPEIPFFASIFNYYLSDDLDGYTEYDERTLELVQSMPGYLGYESLKHNGRGMFTSYWQDMESLQAWGQHPFHLEAKKLGIQRWYKSYNSMIAEVQHWRAHLMD